MDKINTINELIKVTQQNAEQNISSETLQPSEKSLEFIFNYSKALKFYETEQLEMVEVNLN